MLTILALDPVRFPPKARDMKDAISLMPSVSAPRAGSPRAPGRPVWSEGLRQALPLLALFAFTLAFRSIHFGNPDVDFDEPFYLLVGDQMLHGKLPYVDLWDRKPVGLFLIYAAIRLLGGTGFTEYLVVAALFAFATAAFIWMIARRWLAPWPALLPAVCYIVWLEPYSGGGGQTAIFYNLFIIAAFWLVLRARDIGRPATTLRHAALAMLLVGVSIQIKYTVVAEGAFFALGFLWLLWRQGMPLVRVAAAACGLAALALVPTALAIGWYAAIGQLQPFVYANFISLFERGHLQDFYIRENLGFIQIVGLPLAAVAVLGLGRMTGSTEMRADMPWMIGWVVASVAGFVMIGNFYYYYFMPVLVTLSLAAAPNLRERGWGLGVYALLLAWPFYLGLGPSPQSDTLRTRSIDTLARFIAPHVDADHCLYVFDGPTALYMKTHSCLPATRFVYPDHLTNDVERPALGADSVAELRGVLAARPGAIVTAGPKVVPVVNAANVRQMEAALTRDYYPVARVGHAWRIITVWGLKHGPGASAEGNAWQPAQPIRLYPPTARWHDAGAPKAPLRNS